MQYQNILVECADAIGFVFAASVREVTPAQAAALAAPARGRALCVAVTLHPDAARVAEIMAVFQPDVWQTDWQDYAALPVPPASMASTASPAVACTKPRNAPASTGPLRAGRKRLSAVQNNSPNSTKASPRWITSR
jgi:hypothetical protein